MPDRDVNLAIYIMLTVALVFSGGCSHIKKLKTTLYSGVDRRVQQKELVRIDKQIYVKVPNPEATGEEAYGSYLYVPVKEYLANPESYDAVMPTISIPEEEEWTPVELDTVSLPVPQEPAITHQVQVSPHFKKRLMIVPFKDLANPSYNGVSDIVMQDLASQIEAVSDRVILFDADIMRQPRGGRKLDVENFDPSEIARLASQFYNTHAIVMGTINHVFVSSTESTVTGRGKIAYAIAEVSVQLIDAASGKVQRLWDKGNTMLDSEGKGDFSQEKAQLKALKLITSELARDIVEELNGIDWYATIANVDGDRVYVSAGKLSGVRVGDIFSVYPADSPSDPKGEIRVADLFGIDASVADVTKGNDFRTNDLVRPVFQ